MSLEADKAESQAAELAGTGQREAPPRTDISPPCSRPPSSTSSSTTSSSAYGIAATSPSASCGTLYTAYPYMPRLRDRSVLEQGLRDVLNLITWEQEGFALATGYDEASGRYQGLAIPHVRHFRRNHRPRAARTPRPRPPPARAGPQPDGRPAGSTWRSGGAWLSPGGGTVTGPGRRRPRPVRKPPRPKPKTRFFGVYRIDPESYGRDLTKLQQEILPHLADPDTGELRITVEIEATRPDGFPEDKIRIVTENARVLKFERAEFDENS